MNLENIEYFIIYDVHDQKCELITADGGIDVNSD
jgi:hypothetical protein